jgi:hypothetical protein
MGMGSVPAWHSGPLRSVSSQRARSPCWLMTEAEYPYQARCFALEWSWKTLCPE